MIDTNEIRHCKSDYSFGRACTIIDNLCDEVDRLREELSLIKQVRENLVDKIDKYREIRTIGVGFICDLIDGKFANMDQAKKFGQLRLDEMNKSHEKSKYHTGRWCG